MDAGKGRNAVFIGGAGQRILRVLRPRFRQGELCAFQQLRSVHAVRLRDLQIQLGRHGVGKGVSRDGQGVRPVRIAPMPNRIARPRRAGGSSV